MGRFFTKEDRDQLIYYQVPKVLIIGDRYKDMKSNAKLLYITLLDRMKLSLKNDWCDDLGRYYVRMSIEKGSDLLGFSPSTFKNMKKELIKYGLLVEDREGLTKTNRLYILQCEYTEEDIIRINKEVDDMLEEAEKVAQTVDAQLKGKSYPSREVKVTHHDGQNLTTSNNNLINNNSIKNKDLVNKEELVNNESNNSINNSEQETIHKLTNEYRAKGLTKEVCLRVLEEVMANKDNVKNFGAYLRTCLERTLYNHNVKHGLIEHGPTFKETIKNTSLPYYDFSEG